MGSRGPHIKELFDLSGRVAMVVGGAQNLGLDMAEALAEAGADLAITSRSAEKADVVAAELSEHTGARVIGTVMSVDNETSVKAGFRYVAEQYGRLDVLVTTAGGARMSGGDSSVMGRLAADFEAVVLLNIRGTFLCCREAICMMLPARKGSIITVGSISGMVGRDRSVYIGSDMVPNMADYSAAKGGVIALTRDLAAEVGKWGIRVNCISPGGFERGQPAEFIRRYNAQTMLGRMGKDGQDLKGAVVYLASDASGYVTGQNLAVDGGFTAW
jgi:NAD(P)-dependent dehydrogenase (short-subunit alcohol dehydrogenase family)